MKRGTTLIVLILVLALALTACGGKATPAPTDTPVPTETPVPTPDAASTPAAAGVEFAMSLVTKPTEGNVATVNGVAIASETYMGELERQLVFITDSYGVDWNDATYQSYLPQIQMQVIEQLINVELAIQLARAEGIQVSEAALEEELATTRTSILTSGQYTDWANFLAVNKIDEQYFRDRIMESLTIDELVKSHGGPAESEQVWAKHILVADEETAKKVLEELKSGKTFEELAAAYSTDTGSKDSGGDLGWFPRGMMVAPFEEVAFTLPIGEVSEPVQSDFGFHIIKVLGREVRPMDEATLAQAQQDAFGVWFAEQRTSAKIEQFLTVSN